MKMINGVAYARFSSDNQREESIDAQVRAIQYYAQSFGINIVHVYADRAKTGRYDDAKETGEKRREIFTATREQSTALAALAYHVADYNYISQRYGSSDPEAYKADANVKDMFNTLDRLEVPSWVRDEVVAFATDWRRYKSVYMDSYLKSKGIDLIPV